MFVCFLKKLFYSLGSLLYAMSAYLEILAHANVFFCGLYMLSQLSPQVCCNSIIHPR